ncbi:alpha-L-rhamnosidase C-terminal domain-containing protein [Pedobacter agri]|uniref:alpha-L-rhamnosidase C-terminal domain-containing protein n=1 Tax=Pedobacter agri TaxID=454586 RepID=UPI003977D5EC
MKTAPKIDRRLRWARASYESKIRTIKVYWKISKGKVVYQISIPKGMRADFKLT